jgi:hypothetical protein
MWVVVSTMSHLLYLQYPLYRRLCGPRGQLGWVQQISPLAVSELRNNYAIPFHNYKLVRNYYLVVVIIIPPPFLCEALAILR